MMSSELGYSCSRLDSWMGLHLQINSCMAMKTNTQIVANERTKKKRLDFMSRWGFTNRWRLNKQVT